MNRIFVNKYCEKKYEVEHVDVMMKSKLTPNDFQGTSAYDQKEKSNICTDSMKIYE